MKQFMQVFFFCTIAESIVNNNLTDFMCALSGSALSWFKERAMKKVFCIRWNFTFIAPFYAAKENQAMYKTLFFLFDIWKQAL